MRPHVRPLYNPLKAAHTGTAKMHGRKAQEALSDWLSVWGTAHDLLWFEHHAIKQQEALHQRKSADRVADGTAFPMEDVVR